MLTPAPSPQTPPASPSPTPTPITRALSLPLLAPVTPVTPSPSPITIINNNSKNYPNFSQSYYVSAPPTSMLTENQRYRLHQPPTDTPAPTALRLCSRHWARCPTHRVSVKAHPKSAQHLEKHLCFNPEKTEAQKGYAQCFRTTVPAPDSQSSALPAVSLSISLTRKRSLSLLLALCEAGRKSLLPGTYWLRGGLR